MNSIIAVCDLFEDCSHQYCIDLVGKAHMLAGVEEIQVIAVVIGPENEAVINQLSLVGAHKVLILAAESKNQIFTLERAILKIISVHSPELIIFPATEMCKPMASAVAAEMKCGLVADCIGIRKDLKEGYVFTRTAMSSSVVAEIICINSSASICTVKPMAFDGKAAGIHRQADMLKFNGIIQDNLKQKAIEIFNISKNSTIKKCEIEDARIVFGIGRGISPEDVYVLKNIAELIGAEIGYSRAVVERDTSLKARQIGQSGTIIKPQLYVAFGISGASQHLVGIYKSKMIIAINHDKNAPIFSASDYAIVENTHTIISHMKNMVLNYKNP